MSKENKDRFELPENLEFHYLKTNNYRTYHVDGIFGGLTPQGNIYAELFLERAPTPKKVTHRLEKNGTLGEEIARESKRGMIREVEAGVVMDLKTAELFQGWLKEKIEKAKELEMIKREQK